MFASIESKTVSLERAIALVASVTKYNMTRRDYNAYLKLPIFSNDIFPEKTFNNAKDIFSYLNRVYVTLEYYNCTIIMNDKYVQVNLEITLSRNDINYRLEYADKSKTKRQIFSLTVGSNNAMLPLPIRPIQKRNIAYNGGNGNFDHSQLNNF